MAVGEIEADLTMPLVYVSGTKIETTIWTTSISGEDMIAAGMVDPMAYLFGDSFDFTQVQGGGDSFVYDPSPNDGVFGV